MYPASSSAHDRVQHLAMQLLKDFCQLTGRGDPEDVLLMDQWPDSSPYQFAGTLADRMPQQPANSAGETEEAFGEGPHAAAAAAARDFNPDTPDLENTFQKLAAAMASAGGGGQDRHAAVGAGQNDANSGQPISPFRSTAAAPRPVLEDDVQVVMVKPPPATSESGASDSADAAWHRPDPLIAIEQAGSGSAVAEPSGNDVSELTLADRRRLLQQAAGPDASSSAASSQLFDFSPSAIGDCWRSLDAPPLSIPQFSGLKLPPGKATKECPTVGHGLHSAGFENLLQLVLYAPKEVSEYSRSLSDGDDQKICVVGTLVGKPKILAIRGGALRKLSATFQLPFHPADPEASGSSKGEASARIAVDNFGNAKLTWVLNKQREELQSKGAALLHGTVKRSSDNSGRPLVVQSPDGSTVHHFTSSNMKLTPIAEDSSPQAAIAAIYAARKPFDPEDFLPSSRSKPSVMDVALGLIEGDAFQDPLPPELLQQYDLMTWRSAVLALHVPEDVEQYSRAVRRLAFQVGNLKMNVGACSLYMNEGKACSFFIELKELASEGRHSRIANPAMHNQGTLTATLRQNIHDQITLSSNKRLFFLCVMRHQEMYLLQLAHMLERRLVTATERPGSGLQRPVVSESSSLMNLARDALPFQLTGSQEKVLQEILEDLQRSSPMLRLLQGDVGCGKTAVAFLAMLAVVGSGAPVRCL